MRGPDDSRAPILFPRVITANIARAPSAAIELGGSGMKVYADTEAQGWNKIAAMALDDPDPALRLEAAHRLGEIGDALSMQVLEQALYDPDRRVRTAAIDALSVNLSLDIQDILVRALANKDARVRNLAHDLLEELRAQGL
jgi:HEAT repeat protein